MLMPILPRESMSGEEILGREREPGWLEAYLSRPASFGEHLVTFTRSPFTSAEMMWRGGMPGRAILALMKDGRMSDTPPQIEAMQVALLKKAGFTRRAGRLLSLSRSVALLAMRAVRRANPGLSETEVQLRFVEVHYGKELAERLRAFLNQRSA